MRFGDGPSEFHHPVGVAHAMDLGCRCPNTQVPASILTPSGGCLQIVCEPFEGAYQRAGCRRKAGVCHRQPVAAQLLLPSPKRRRSCCCASIRTRRRRRWTLVLAPARDSPRRGNTDGAAAPHTCRPYRTRPCRHRLSRRASHSTRDDVAALVPAAHEHATHHPELYSLPPVRSTMTSG